MANTPHVSQANVLSGIDYSRQEVFTQAMHNIHLGDEHIIVGCGGIGWWLAMLLALHGVEKLTLIDGDTVEASNLNRLPVPVAWKGMKKVIGLRKLLKSIRPELIVKVVPMHLDGMLLTQSLEKMYNSNVQIWDCTDHLATQIALFKHCSSHAANYRKIGYEGFEIGTYVDYSVWATTDANPQQGYRTSAANAVSSVMAACLGMLAAGMGIEQDANINLKHMVEKATDTRRALVNTTVEQEFI